MKKTSLLIAAGLMVLMAGGCVNRQAQQEAKATEKIVSNPVISVSVQTVTEAPVIQTQEITGGVTTADDASVGAKISGRITAVYVKDGDPVSAGQVIASQDTSTLNAQLSSALAGLASARSNLSQAVANAAIQPSKSSAAVNAAQAQLRSAKATLQKAKTGARPEERAQSDWQVKAAKSALDLAKIQLDRQKQLFDQGAVARQQLDQAQNAYDAALTGYNSALQGQLIQVNGTRSEDLTVAQEAVRAAEDNLRTAQAQKKLDVLLSDQVQSAQAGVQSAQAQVAIAQQAVADAQIRSPFAGHISGRPLQAGTMASPGMTIARIIGGQGAYFEGQVSEGVVAKLTVGSPVQITVDALGKRVMPGSIAAISPLGTDVGRLFSIRVAFNGSTDGVKPGMYARGVVQIGRIPNAVMVPVNAVLSVGADSVAYIVDGKKAKAVKVKVGIRQGDQVQVTGLQPGQQLVVRGQETLVDGSQVQIDKSSAVSANATATVRG